MSVKKGKIVDSEELEKRFLKLKNKLFPGDKYKKKNWKNSIFKIQEWWDFVFDDLMEKKKEKRKKEKEGEKKLGSGGVGKLKKKKSS